MRIAHSKSFFVLGTLSVGACVAAGWMVLNVDARTTEARAVVLLPTLQQANSEQLRLAMSAAGLSPQSLTAAGVTSEVEVVAVVNRVKNHLAGSPEAVKAAFEAMGTARQAVADLERSIQSGTAGGEALQALGAARTNLQTAIGNRDTVIAGIYNAGVNNLDETQRTVLARIRNNGENWNCPTEFLVIDRSEPNWVTLVAELAHERIAAKRGTAVDQDVQAALTVARNEPTVSLALSRLATSLAGVQQTWDAATTVNGGG